MIKLWSALYVFTTSIAYFYIITNANKWYEEKIIALPILCAIVVFLAFIISFFKDKISEVETTKKIKEKENALEKLTKKLQEKEAIIHHLKSTFVNNVLSAPEQSPEEFLVIQRALAMKLNEDPVINNVAPDGEEDIPSYLGILKASYRATN